MSQFKIGDKVRRSLARFSFPVESIDGKDLTVIGIENVPANQVKSVGHAQWLDVGVENKQVSGALLELAPPAPALIRADRKYRTRDGRAVKRIICTDAEGDFPVVAVLAKGEGSNVAEVATFTAEGKYGITDGEYRLDLIEIPAEPIVGYVNLYRTQGGRIAVSTALSPDGPDPLPAPTNAVWLASAKVEVLP
jgi:hypothetical protein